MSAAEPVEVNPQIFREYDIRGIVDKDLTDPVLETIGRAYATMLYQADTTLGPGEGREAPEKNKRVVVGRDVRLSSQRFAKALIGGLRAAGCDVIDIGAVPTPVLYFAVGYFNTDGGVVVTASHNPPQFNGLKMRKVTAEGLNAPLSNTEVQELGRIANAGIFHEGASEGSYEQGDALTPYQDYIVETVKPARRLKVVLDAGNGASGPSAVEIYERMGVEIIPMYIEPDGNFPNHVPNPLKEENMVDLQAKVRETRADIGIGLDGDGDRLGVVDDQGEILWPDMYMILIERLMLAKGPTSIIFDVKCGRALIEDITQHGGTPVMWKTGYTNIFAKRLEINAGFAGEYSGHMFFDDPRLNFDDGTYAGARLIEALAADPRPISERFADVHHYYNTPEGRIDVDESTKVGLIDTLRAQFSRDYKVVTLDGVRVEFPDGWFLVRASNTEPSLTTRFEAETPERLEELKTILRDALKQFPAVKANF